MATHGGAGGAERILLFGLTTAFMFAMIQQIWPLGSRIHHNITGS